MINFTKFQNKFAQVIQLPANYEVYDFTQKYNPNRTRSSEFGIGKYNEKRVGMYDAEIFSGVRNIHMGIDIAAPVGTDIAAFAEGNIFLFGNNPQKGDYGFTIITEHVFDNCALYALYGHLSAKSIANKKQGQKILAGEIIAWVGDKHENGDWNPHLHFQLSYEKPTVPDMPGVVSEENHQRALKIYPDPQLVLGKLY